MASMYKKAESLEEALELKNRHGEGGVFIAGGTDLLVDIRNNTLEPQPEIVIDISCLEEIDFIKRQDGRISIGAAVTLSEIEKSPMIRSYAPVLVQACQKCANPLIRNKATLGGNLVNASPAADTATPLLVLGASAVLRSINGERIIPLEDFFSDVKKTNHKNNELLTELRFDVAQEKKCRFLKLGQRNGTSISIVSLSLIFDISDGIINNDLKIALGSVAPVPLRAYRTEEILRGSKPSPENIKKAGSVIKDEVSPISDVRASSDYRREMSAVLLRLAFQNLGFGHG